MIKYKFIHIILLFLYLSIISNKNNDYLQHSPHHHFYYPLPLILLHIFVQFSLLYIYISQHFQNNCFQYLYLKFHYNC